MEVRSGGGGICVQGLRGSSHDAARALRTCPIIDALHHIDEEFHPKRPLRFEGCKRWIDRVVHRSHVQFKDIALRLLRWTFFKMKSSSRLAKCLDDLLFVSGMEIKSAVLIISKGLARNCSTGVFSGQSIGDPHEQDCGCGLRASNNAASSEDTCRMDYGSVCDASTPQVIRQGLQNRGGAVFVLWDGSDDGDSIGVFVTLAASCQWTANQVS